MKRVVVEKPGASADLLLIPGNDLAAEFYLSLAESLASLGLRSTLLTLPGFHSEPKLPLPGWRPMLAAILDELDRTKPADLLGHSLGGMLALLAAAERPEISRLVLMEPAIPPGKLLAQAAVRRYRRQVIDADRARFVNWSGSFYRVHDPERFPQRALDLYLEIRRTSDPDVARALVESLPDLYPLPFAKIRARVLLLYGESSGWATTLGLLYLGRQLPKLERRIIRGAAHWMANEQDDAIAQEIARFFTG